MYAWGAETAGSTIPPVLHWGSMTEFPPFRLDLINQCLWCRKDEGDEERIPLPPKTFAMLRYLVEHAGRLVTQDELLEALWPEVYIQPEVLKTHVRGIRVALGDDSKNPCFIETLPRRGYRFIAPVKETSRPTNLGGDSPASRLVGRNEELERLRESLRRAACGERRLVWVTGEPGIGKTALVDEFQRQAAAHGSGFRIARGQCVEGYGGTEPYYPMLEALGHLCRGPGADSVVQVLAAQAPTWLAQLPALMKREQREKLQHEILGATRERMLREMAEALETITAEGPLVLVFEDLQWVDPSTVDLLSVVARRRQLAKLLVIGTYRPVDVLLADHPLKGLKQDLVVHHLCHEIALRPLKEAEVAEYLAAESEGAILPDGLPGLIYRHSEGNPLFMVSALTHMRNRGLIAVENGSWRLTVPVETIDVEAPESLRQMIELQIERLDPDEQRALELASIAGSPFSVARVAALGHLGPATMEDVCERLARRHHMLRPVGRQDMTDGTVSTRYEFVHALYREVLYRRQTQGRRMKLHMRLGELLEASLREGLKEVSPELPRYPAESSDWTVS